MESTIALNILSSMNPLDLNPDIIELAKRRKDVRDCVEMFLNGSLDWIQCLETIVLALGKEVIASNIALSSFQTENRELFVALKAPYKEKIALLKLKNKIVNNNGSSEIQKKKMRYSRLQKLCHKQAKMLSQMQKKKMESEESGGSGI